MDMNLIMLSSWMKKKANHEKVMSHMIKLISNIQLSEGVMAKILYVRLKSNLDDAELERRINERKPRFFDVPGLIQKVYGEDENSGEVCGIYFFENKEALDAYLESDLAKTIPTAYEATSVRKEVYDVMFPLYPECGPV